MVMMKRKKNRKDIVVGVFHDKDTEVKTQLHFRT